MRAGRDLFYREKSQILQLTEKPSRLLCSNYGLFCFFSECSFKHSRKKRISDSVWKSKQYHSVSHVRKAPGWQIWICSQSGHFTISAATAAVRGPEEEETSLGSAGLAPAAPALLEVPICLPASISTPHYLNSVLGFHWLILPGLKQVMAQLCEWVANELVNYKGVWSKGERM